MTDWNQAPVAAPRAVPLSAAEPAKIIGWLLLAGWGMLCVVMFAPHPSLGGFAFAAIPWVLLAGFVQSHRYPRSAFSKVWLGFFTLFILAGALFTHVVALFG